MYKQEAHEIAEELKKWKSRKYPLITAIITLANQVEELKKQIEKCAQREKEILGDQEYTERQKNIAMQNRLISIAKGCKSVKRLADDADHDDDCWERDSVLFQIYSIITGKHNWPEAMPYEPVKEDSNG